MDDLNDLLEDLEVMFGETSDVYCNAASDLNSIYEDINNLKSLINHKLDKGE